jgi:hypothetical protein
MACWKITIEIVNFPMNSMVVFHDDVNVYQRVNDLPDVPKCLGDSPRKQGNSWLSPGKNPIDESYAPVGRWLIH